MLVGLHMRPVMFALKLLFPSLSASLLLPLFSPLLILPLSFLAFLLLPFLVLGLHRLTKYRQYTLKCNLYLDRYVPYTCMWYHALQKLERAQLQLQSFLYTNYTDIYTSVYTHTLLL